MIIAWLVYFFALLIFLFVGLTGIHHAKKYRIKGDLTKKATIIYVTLMALVIIITILAVLKNGANAPLNLSNFRVNFYK